MDILAHIDALRAHLDGRLNTQDEKLDAIASAQGRQATALVFHHRRLTVLEQRRLVPFLKTYWRPLSLVAAIVMGGGITLSVNLADIASALRHIAGMP